MRRIRASFLYELGQKAASLNMRAAGMEYLVGAYPRGGALAAAAGGVVREDWTRVQVEVPTGRG